MSTKAAVSFEHWPPDMAMDETDVSLRAYVSRLDEDHLAKYDRNWSDEQVMEWDGNFRSDGDLMLVCCERDVDMDEYRRVLAACVEYRNEVREKLSA